MAAHSAFASRWSQQSGPVLVSLAMLAVLVLVFFAHALSPTNITSLESSLDESFDADEVAVKTSLSPESREGISSNVLTPTTPLSQVSTASNLTSGAEYLHAAKSETLLEESARDAWTGFMLEKVQGANNSGEEKQELGQDSGNEILKNWTSMSERKGQGDPVPERMGQSPGTQRGSESESGLRKESQWVSEGAAGGRKKDLVEGGAETETDTGTELKLEKGISDEAEGKQQDETDDGNEPEKPDQVAKAETQLATESGSKPATENRRPGLDPGSRAEEEQIGTGTESQPVVQKASTSETHSGRESESRAGSGLEQDKWTKGRAEDKPKTGTATNARLEEDNNAKTVGNAEAHQQYEANAALDERDDQSRTESVIGSRPGTPASSASGNWTRTQTNTEIESVVGISENETEGRRPSFVQNEAVSGSVNTTESYPGKEAENVIDGKGKGIKAVEETTSKTDLETESQAGRKGTGIERREERTIETEYEAGNQADGEREGTDTKEETTSEIETDSQADGNGTGGRTKEEREGKTESEAGNQADGEGTGTETEDKTSSKIETETGNQADRSGTGNKPEEERTSETVSEAGKQADGEGTVIQTEEAPTSKTGVEVARAKETKGGKSETSASPRSASPRTNDSTRTDSLLVSETPEASDATTKYAGSQTSEPKDFELESLAPDTFKSATEAAQSDGPDELEGSKWGMGSEPSPELHTKAAAELGSGSISNGSKGQEAALLSGQEIGRESKVEATDAGRSSPGKEVTNVETASDSLHNLAAGKAEGEEGDQPENTRLPPVTTSEAETSKDLTGIPDWAIKHFLDDPKAAAARPRLNPKCNLYKGKWVYDKSYPLWTDYMHPFLQDRPENCQRRGRKDTDYMKMRWQPDGCNLPRFDAADVRKRLWGRRLVYVGDSLGRNMFSSMFGMLLHEADPSRIHEGLRETNQSKVERWTPTTAYFFTEHNFTMEYYRSPVLVELKRAPKEYGPNVTTLVHPHLPSLSWALPANSADIVVFNAGHWFNHGHLSASGWFPEVNGVLQMEPDWAAIFVQSMRTWARWARQRRSAGRQIFFRGLAPTHLSRRVARTCPAEYPIWDPSPHPKEAIEISVKKIWHELGRPAEYLDITALSGLRNDAHVGGLDTKVDCSHWCFPGVPDTWNELLVATMLLRGVPPFDSIYAANLDNNSAEWSPSDK